MQFPVIVIYFLAIFLAIYLGKKYHIEWKRVLSLVILVPVLFGIIVVMVDMFIPSQEDDVYVGIFLSALLSMFYSFLIMLPSLMVASVGVLIVEKELQPKPLNLFLWAMVIGGVSAIIPAMLISLIFIVVAMIMGTLAVMIEYYYLGGVK